MQGSAGGGRREKVAPRYSGRVAVCGAVAAGSISSWESERGLWAGNVSVVV